MNAALDPLEVPSDHSGIDQDESLVFFFPPTHPGSKLDRGLPEVVRSRDSRGLFALYVVREDVPLYGGQRRCGAAQGTDWRETCSRRSLNLGPEA